MKKFFVLLLLFGTQFSFAQAPKHLSSTQIYNKIEKLNFLGSVLYVAAHPDDENTTMISYLSNKTNARVGYLSLTRGDGGQNLIGPEIRELLGVIRTEELLSARRIDGGHQYFTRANDFGYSKTPAETFHIWDKQKVLSDVVWTFRKFQPDVIINRFNHRTEGRTHGHHTASARLSVEAFDLAGEKDKFTDQLNYYDTWQPKRLFFNTFWWFYGSKEKFEKIDKSGFLKLDVGNYLPLRGQSNTEISALSRSQHKSQGFGVIGKRGSEQEYLEPIKGDFPKNGKSVFAGIDTTWSRVKGGKAIGNILKAVQQNFNFKNPAASIPQLLKAYKRIENLENDHWRKIKSEEIKEIIAACAGLYLDASSAREFQTQGQTVDVNFEAINRSPAKVNLKSVSISTSKNTKYSFDKTLKTNRDFQQTETFKIPENLKPRSPYWLTQPHNIGMYRVDKTKLIGLPETPPQLVANFHMTINGVAVNFDRDLKFKTSTPTQGEVEKPFAIVPEASVAMHNKTLVFSDNSSKKVKVDVKAYKDNVSGTVRLNHPENWTVSPKQIDLKLAKKGKKKTVTFMITPPRSETEGKINPKFTIGGKSFTKELHHLDYPHIRAQTVLLPAETKVIRLDIKTKGKTIAYIKGAGDEVPESLREIGYRVTVMSPKAISLKKLQAYDAVVVGIRAYDTDKSLVLNQNVLFDYIKKGGTVINQYNTTRELKTDKVAPFPLNLSHDRVTDEHSEVEFLAPKHPVLNSPNKITKKDFEGWVQERGLYFPNEWSDEFTPILGMHDKGEATKKGSLLVAKYGKGYFVYTGLSFFRELPAGVSGAFRLFANLLALKN